MTAASMRRQLLSWLLPSALAVLVAFSACAYVIARGALLQEARRGVQTLTVAAAGRVEAFFSQRESDILAAAESPLLRDHYLNAEFGLKEEAQEALAAVRDMLARLSKRTGVYPSLAYLDRSGRELCRVGAPSKAPGVMRFSAVVRDERGAARGFLVFDCSLASVESFLASLKVGVSGRARLVPRGEHGAVDLSGQTVRDWAGVGATPWAVEVEADRAEFLGGLDRLWGATILFFLVAAALLALGIGRQTSVLLRPLARLEEAARRYAEGRFETRVLAEGPREVQTVARAFNAMADRLLERTRELQARVRELSALQGLSQSALLRSGRAEVASACLEAAVAGLGFSRGAFYRVDEQAGMIVGECAYGGRAASREALKSWRVSVDSSDIVAHVYRTRRAAYVADPKSDPRCDKALVEVSETRAFALAPVLAGERVLAIIAVDSGEKGGTLDDASLLSLSMFCAAAGVVLDNTRLRDQLLHSEKLSAAGSLLAGVTHELNSPLQALSGHAEMALESSGEQHGEDLRVVYEQAMRCRDIVAGLLRFVRQESTARERVPVNAVVEETLGLMNYRIKKKELATLVLALDPRGPEAGADFRQLQQVLVNLLMNACDAVSGRPDPREIRVGTEKVSGGSVVWVEDTGPGVPEALRGKIFEPFFTTKPPGHGTGLGLAISAQIVRDMGGSLTCEQAPLGGARFVVRLPACPAGVEERPRAPEDMPEARPGKRVLLVDDEPAVVHLMERLAKDDGLLTAVESGVEKARARLEEEGFDLVVADVEMDGRRGLELLKYRKNGKPGFVFVTGDTLNAALRREVAGLGAPLLSKPFMRVDFLREVRKGLAGA